MVRQSFFQDLSADHRRLADMVMSTKIERDPDRLVELASSLDLTFRRHFEVEDQELYPTLLEVVDDWDDRTILIGAHEDHRIIMKLLGELEDTPPTHERFRGKIHSLDKMWNHHYEEEEDALYDMARTYLDQEGFSDLVRRVRRAESIRGMEVPVEEAGGGDGAHDPEKSERISRQTRE